MTKGEAARGETLHLEAESGVVEAEPGDAITQFCEVGGVGGEEPAEDDGLDLLEAGERRARA